MSHWLSIRKGGLDPLPGGCAVRNICDRNAGPSAAGLDGLPMLHQRRLRRCHGASDGSLWSVLASGSTWCWTDSAAVARRADSNPPGQCFAPATPPGRASTAPAPASSEATASSPGRVPTRRREHEVPRG